LGYGRCRLRLLFFEFDQPPAGEEAVEDNADSDQKWDYSYKPQTAKHLREIVVVSPRHYFEEEMEEDHQADADEAGDDAALHLIDPFLFRGNADPQLFHGMRMGYLGPPAFVPIGLSFGGVGSHRVADAAQIRAALLAEFEIIVDLKTACGTEHSNSF